MRKVKFHNRCKDELIRHSYILGQWQVWLEWSWSRDELTSSIFSAGLYPVPVSGRIRLFLAEVNFDLKNSRAKFTRIHLLTKKQLPDLAW